MDVCETINMDQLKKVRNFEPMKVHTFGTKIRLIGLFNLMLNYAKPRLLALADLGEGAMTATPPFPVQTGRSSFILTYMYFILFTEKQS